MKSTSTISELAYTGSLIWPIGMKTFPSKLTKGESQAVKSSGFKFSPLYKSGYIISAPLPWSTNTLFTSYPSILRVTTKASSYGYMVPILFLFEKLKVSWISTLALFGLKLKSSTYSQATDITLEGWELVLLGAAKMTLIVPKRALEEASVRDPNPTWLPTH